MAKFGKSTIGMPPLLVTRGAADELMLIDGVTRATRVGKLLPNSVVTVEVVDEILDWDLSSYPTVEERLP